MIRIDENARISATGLLNDGRHQVIEVESLSFSTSDPEVVTVSRDGIATSRGDGYATIVVKHKVPVQRTAGRSLWKPFLVSSV